MLEWSNSTVSKTAGGEIPTWVRIPVLPRKSLSRKRTEGTLYGKSRPFRSISSTPHRLNPGYKFSP